MSPIDPELLAAIAEDPAGEAGPVWARPSGTLAGLAGVTAADRAGAFRRALAEGYFSQYTAYSDPRLVGRVVDWHLAELDAAGRGLPDGLAESPLVRPETCVTRRGRVVSPDLLRYALYADHLLRHGALAAPRPRVLEIGGGYGGFARTVKRLVPAASVVLVDLPASLAHAYFFLRAEFPDARLAVAPAGDAPGAPGDADFVFVPARRAGVLRGAAFDLAVNVWSFGEIPNGLNRGWFDLLQDGMRVDWVFLLNAFLKRVGPRSAGELDFGRWLTLLDDRWRVVDFEIDPRPHQCPYVTNFPNGAAVLARRAGAAGELDADRAAARAAFEDVRAADWAAAAEADPDAGLRRFLGAGHHIGRWRLDPGRGGTLFRLWDQARLNRDPAAVRLLLAYLQTLRGHGGDGYRFKDEFYFRELLPGAEAARERDAFFEKPAPPPPPRPVTIPFTPQEACDLAGAARAGGGGHAEAAYLRILEACPGHGECLFQLGALAEGRGDHAAAADWYRRAYALAPDNPNYRARAARYPAPAGAPRPARAG